MLSLWSCLSALALAGLIDQTALVEPAERQMRHASGHHGAVASESTICSDIGIGLLKQGGNAADAVSARADQGVTRLRTDATPSL